MKDFSVVIRVRAEGDAAALKSDLMNMLIEMDVAVLDCTVVQDNGEAGAAARAKDKKPKAPSLLDAHRHQWW